MGISIMGRGSVGSTIEPDSFIQRQRLADELYKNSIATPQTPELSWTQGAARLAQAIASGYERGNLNKDRQAYQDQRKADMQLLGNALASGDYKSVMGQLSDPESQKMAFSLAAEDNKERAQSKGNMQLALLKRSLENKDSTEKFNQTMALKKADHAFGRDNYLFERGDKLADKNSERAFELNKMGVQSEYGRGDKFLDADLKKEEKLSDPIKSAQQRYANFARLANDPNAPEEIRAVAASQLESLKQSLTDMQPSRTSIKIDTGDKSEAAGDKAYKQAEGKAMFEQEQKDKQGFYNAQDNLMRIDTIQKAIESGELTNQNTTDFGQALETLGARMGVGNDSASIGNFIQTTNQQLIDARKQLQGQGSITDYETKLLAGTQLQPTDTMEQILSKMFVQKQAFQRMQNLGDLTNEWSKRFGSTKKPAENGMTFYDAATNLYKAKPIISYADYQKAQEDMASQATPTAPR